MARKTYLFLIVAILALCPATALAWDTEGFNFRETCAYVTDGADETCARGQSQDSYPTTRNSLDFGWGASYDTGRDRDSGLDRRIAGQAYRANDGTQSVWCVDGITAGTYDVAAAFGDATQTPSYVRVDVYECSSFNTSCDSLFSCVDTNGVATEGAMLDANCTEHTKANWASSNTTREVTVAKGTICVKLGATSAQASSSAIAHISFAPAGAPTPTPTPTPTPAPTPWPCGADLDLDSDVDVACPAGDVDGDGYTTTDCDDTNRYMYPGITTTAGCSAGQYKQCTGPSYTACANISTYDPGGADDAFWVSADETDCSGAGTYADPEDYRCHFNTGMSGYTAPTSGDYIILKCSGGDYTAKWGAAPERMFYLNNINGVHIVNEPGCAFWEAGYGLGTVINGQGTSPNYIFPVNIFDSLGTEIRGLEIDGTGGYSTTGINFAGEGGRVHGNYVHDIDGESGDNNTCIYNNNTNNHEVDHNLTKNCVEIGTEDNSNNVNILTMESESGVLVHHNVSIGGGAQGYGNCIKSKHGGVGASGQTIDIYKNICYNFRQKGIVAGCIDNLHIYNNFLHTTGTIDGSSTLGYPISLEEGGGGDDECDNIIIERNTIFAGSSWTLNPPDDYAAFGNPAVTVRYNIFQDNQAADYSGDPPDGFGRMWQYGSDADFTALVTGNRIVIDENCYYNSESTPLEFNIFGDNGSTSLGAAYADFTAYVAGTPFDTNSHEENPLLDVYGRATSANCDEYGWLLTSEETGGGGVSTGTTTGRGAVFRLLRSKK